MNSVQLLVDGALFHPFAQIVLFVLGTIGLTHIVVDSSLFAPARRWLQGKLPEKIYRVFECYQCAGTWCGFLVGWMTMSTSLWTILVCGFAGSFLASWAAFYLNYLEAKTMIAMNDQPKKEKDVG
jgi:hypothetical protein